LTVETAQKIIVSIVCFILFCVFVFFSGYYYGTRNIEPGVIYKDRVVTNTIYRDRALTFDECKGHLEKYDQGNFILDIKHKEENRYTIYGELHERKASRDVEIELSRSGDWRFYVAGAALAGAAFSLAVFR